ncbi:hypothetical protein FOL46_004429 [Perkinsus olseni]|uniref:Uncharacterized protein n=1 Tax=Perkinsus olseni TaxID=32597 RepID=A0A7J6MST5_PEROL|nr:hypothetical protein FOL46_004429 [Perkinsus olseni]
MKLREYQTEVLDKIRQHQSTVAFMPTGSGKTLVAVRLLDERVEVQMHRQREGELRKACIFTAPNKVLCHQQAKYIEEHLRQEEPRVLVLTGEVKETVAWEEKEWAAALRESSVVVCVPEVLRRAMESGFVRGDWIDTLIFDECHHCVSKNGTNSGHAYCHLAQLAKGAERFVGLTASPLNCKRVDVEENLKQLKKVLALGGECEVVRPTVNEEELGQWVFAPQLEFKYFQPSQYPPQCKRFFQECGADPGRVHKFICNAYHRVSWLEEYYSLRRSITTLGKDAADFGMPPITLRPNERDLPLHVLSYYCEMLGQMGKILHECGTRTAAHALEFICRASTDDIDECTIPEAYNKAKTTISLDRLQRRVERLKEFCRENAEADLFDQPVVDAFRNRYGPNKKILSSSDEDGVSEELLELARRSLSTRLPRPPSAFKKPWRDVNILYAYSLSAQWDSSSVSVPPRRQARYDKTRQRATAVNKLMLLTPGPLDLAVCHAVGHIPLSASGLGRSDSSMGTMQISLNPYHQHGGSSGAVEVDLALMNTLWGFHREIFSAGEVPCVDWHECEEGQEFWMMVPDMEVDRSEFDGVLAAFKDDSRLLLDFARTVCELSRMTQSYNLLALPPLSPRVLYEVLTPKRCHAMVDSERYEALGSSVLQLVASEYVWSQQFSAGEASLEGKLTDDRQEIISHSRTSQKAIDGGILDLIHSAAETGTSLTQEVLVSIANAARSCLLALVGALCDVHGIEAAVQATTKFQLVPNLPSRGLIAHGSPGEERDMDDWQLPKDFPPHLRERLRNPPVTYDTLTGAVQDSPSEIGGYVFGKHPWLLSESLTHASVTAVSAAYSNERLEWLGDAVLGAVVLRRLFQHQEPPRQLVKAFTDNVCNANLAKVAVERLDVHKRFNTFSTPLLGAIRRFVRELSSGRATVRRGPKPLADCVEAILGAVWIDAGGLADGGWAAAWDFVTSNIVVAPDRALSVEVVDLTSSPSQDEPSSPVLAECSATETIPPKELGLKRPAPASPNSSAKRRASESVNSEEDAVALREQLARLANTLNAEQLRRVVDVIESEIAPRGST